MNSQADHQRAASDRLLNSRVKVGGGLAAEKIFSAAPLLSNRNPRVCTGTKEQ